MFLSYPREQGRLPGVGDVSLSKMKSEAFLLHSGSPSTVAAGDNVSTTKPQAAVGCAQAKVGPGEFHHAHSRHVAGFYLLLFTEPQRAAPSNVVINRPPAWKPGPGARRGFQVLHAPSVGK